MGQSLLHLYENEQVVARRWWNLPEGIGLPVSTGGLHHLVFAGYPGGAAGPDVCDAVLDEHRVGDVEFHLCASDWFAHQHHLDPRYNKVILHVVLVCNSAIPTQRQDGAFIPTPMTSAPSPPLWKGKVLGLFFDETGLHFLFATQYTRWYSPVMIL